MRAGQDGVAVASYPQMKPGALARPLRATDQTLWVYVVPFVVIHLSLLLAFVPWLFSWTGLLMIPIGNYIFCSIGIGLCYHRTLTHRGLILPKRLEHFFAILGVCSLQDSPLRWVTTHRIHHQNSDQQADPHSPLVNFFWGHMGWMLVDNDSFNTTEAYVKHCPDLLRDRFYKRLEKRYTWLLIYIAHMFLFFLAGFLFDWIATGEAMRGVQFGLSLVLYGVLFRTIYTWHVTWAVNSVAHRWGYRSFKTSDSSRNNWIVALLTNGEGWHNNHHADQRCASHGRRWWELDVTYLTILVLERFGLARSVRKPAVISDS